MLEQIRAWLMGVTCAAIIAAIADSLTPSGAVRHIGRITCSLILLLTMLRPAIGLDPDLLVQSLTEYHTGIGTYSDALDRADTELMSGLISERSAEYIVTRAAEAGITCRAEVLLGEGDPCPVPTRIIITGALSAAQWKMLSGMIEEDFGLAAKQLEYRREVSTGS